jgi:hypothetical protein
MQLDTSDQASTFLTWAVDVFLEHPPKAYFIGDAYFTESSLLFVPYATLTHLLNKNVAGLGRELWRIRTGASGGFAGQEYERSGAANELIYAVNQAANVRSAQWGLSLDQRAAQAVAATFVVQRTAVIDVASNAGYLGHYVTLKRHAEPAITFGVAVPSDFARLCQDWKASSLAKNVGMSLSFTSCPRWEHLVAALAAGNAFDVPSTYVAAMASSEYLQMFLDEYTRLAPEQMASVRAGLLQADNAFTQAFDDRRIAVLINEMAAGDSLDVSEKQAARMAVPGYCETFILAYLRLTDQQKSNVRRVLANVENEFSQGLLPFVDGARRAAARSRMVIGGLLAVAVVTGALASVRAGIWLVTAGALLGAIVRAFQLVKDKQVAAMLPPRAPGTR